MPISIAAKIPKMTQSVQRRGYESVSTLDVKGAGVKSKTMVETLYKTNSPKTFAQGEYYQPRLDHEIRDGKDAYFVRETHGWFNDSIKKPANITKTLSPDEGFSTEKEAWERYNAQVQKRVSEGFEYSFTLDPFNNPPYNCTRLVPFPVHRLPAGV